MELAEKGDLASIISREVAIQEIYAHNWFRQIVSGLQYLHNHHIAHRDLTCKNILLSQHFTIKISDFGFCCFCVSSTGQSILSETYCGTKGYAAPEIMRHIPYDPKAADIWSLGVILFVMLNGVMPFDGKNDMVLLQSQIYRKWMETDIMSPFAGDLVEELLVPEASSRPRLNKVLQHIWVTQSNL
jgi:serine kinase